MIWEYKLLVNELKKVDDKWEWVLDVIGSEGTEFSEVDAPLSAVLGLLNRMGSIGWELVSQTNVETSSMKDGSFASTTHYMLKRAKPASSAAGTNQAEAGASGRTSILFDKEWNDQIHGLVNDLMNDK